MTQVGGNPVFSQPSKSHSPSQEQSGKNKNQSFMSSQNNSVVVLVGIRLPKLDLLKFNGDITQFYAFWQSFECAIHSDKSLSGIHKLNYLVNLLEGPAYRVVAGLSLMEENYEHAVQTLKDHFGNKQRIISAHIKSLLKVQDCPNEKVSQLRYIYDNINVHVHGLEALGMPQESYGSLLIPIIMQRMPSEITIQVARKVTEDIWPIKESLDIIKREIEAREMGIAVSDKKPVRQVNQPRQPSSTTQAFVTRDDQRNQRARQRSYVTEELKKKVNLQVESIESLNINTFGTEKYNKIKCESVRLSIAVESQSRPIVVRALIYPSICSPLSSCLDISDYPYLHGLQLADSITSQRKRIDLLIGADHFYDFVTGEVIRGNSGPVAIKSKLGWLLSGPYTSLSDSFTNDANINAHLILDSSPQCFCITDTEVDLEIDANDEIAANLQKFWKHEALGLNELTENDVSEQKEKEEFQIDFNGKRYEVSLPWNADFSDEFLQSNYELCNKRLQSLFSKLKDKPDLLQEYDTIFQEQLKNGIIERVSDCQEKQVKIHYLCHHGVFRKDHNTTKLQIVFDASGKGNINSLCLNDSSY